MATNTSIERVKFWCFKVLPLVYDDSLSYYEVLCKVVEKLNEVIKAYEELPEYIEEINAAIAKIQEWIDSFDTSIIETWIAEHLAQMIFVEITDDGYFKVYIPESWEDITFNTTGLDTFIDGYDFGHLVLSY